MALRSYFCQKTISSIKCLVSWNGQCVDDSEEDRLLPYGLPFLLRYNTPAMCIAYCYNRGDSFAGLKTEHGCFCGSVAPPQDKIVDMGQCNIECPGDTSKTCGGSSAMNIYNAEGIITVNIYHFGFIQ